MAQVLMLRVGILPSHLKQKSDLLIQVDHLGRAVGAVDALTSHLGGGTRHRAFSIWLTLADGRILLQQRSRQKLLWPMFWANSCCSHPRQGESIEQAAERRLQEELNICTNVPLKRLYSFEYRAEYMDIGVEHEHCTVLLGQLESGDLYTANPDEICDLRLLPFIQLEQEVFQNPEQFTPWFLLEWDELRSRFRDRFEEG